MDIFGQIDQEAMLKMNEQLTPLEYQIFTVYKVEEYLGKGAVNESKKKLAQKYKFKNYTNFSRVVEQLIAMNWLIDSPAGIKCQTDFTKTIPRKVKEKSSKTTKKVANNATSGETELQKTQNPVANSATSDCKKRNNSEASKDNNIHTQESGENQEFVKDTHSSSADGARRERAGEKIAGKQKTGKRGKFSKNALGKAFAKIAEIWRKKKTKAELRSLSSSERGQINQNLKKLRQMNANLEHLPIFEDWWRQTWRAGGDGAPYEPPRPDQFVSFWNVMLDWALAEGKIRAPEQSPEKADAAPLISQDEWHDLLRYCPDCFGYGRDMTPGKGSPKCEHEKVEIILEKLEQAAEDGEINRELVERFKEYLASGDEGNGQGE